MGAKYTWKKLNFDCTLRQHRCFILFCILHLCGQYSLLSFYYYIYFCVFSIDMMPLLSQELRWPNKFRKKYSEE